MNSGLLVLALLQAAGGHSEHSETASLDFEYSWPAEADRIPALRARLRGERNAAHARAGADAARDARERRRGGFEAMGHSYARHWQVAGSNPALLSLISTESTFTGGAHGNQALSALLWDRQRSRATAARAVIGPRALDAMRGRYCARLDAMRSERRGGERIVRDPGDSFTICPPIAAQMLAPADADADGRFDSLCILFSPYAVGPYAEGDYVVALPFRRADVAAIPAAYRARFEAGSATRNVCGVE